MKFRYPTQDDKIPAYQARSGFYPVNKYNRWHGGVHIKSDTVHCMADGYTNRILKKTEVKRIRINENEYSYYVNSSFTNKNNESELYEGFFKEFADEFPPYNWNKFGFGKRSATDEKTTCWFWKSEDAGKYIFDYDTTKSELIKQIVERIDTDGNKTLDEKEIDLALGNGRIKYELSRFICYHRSEWSYSDTSTLEEEVKTFYERYIDKEKN